MAKVRKTKESQTGRNTHFEVSRADLVKMIKAGTIEGYHIRKINGVDTPCSNPDSKKGNNLN